MSFWYVELQWYSPKLFFFVLRCFSVTHIEKHVESQADTRSLVDCLYEGPSFPELMAHIARRHPTATPDDFIPGLIHHRPIELPTSASKLPRLPHFANIHSDRQAVAPYEAEVGVRTKRLVSKGCFSGRRPRKEDYEDKKGALVAIGAALENARRFGMVNDRKNEYMGEPTK